MRVPFSYLREQFADAEPILGAIKDLLVTGQFTLGKPVADFEQAFARLCRARFAIGVNSGTDALFLALKCLGIGPGHEVITAVNTFVATAGAIVQTGAKPVFVDIGDDFTIDPRRVAAAVTPRTRAILPVHYAGTPAHMDALQHVAKAQRIAIVEDACQAVGATLHNQPVGSFGVAAAFSLHPLKNLNVWGDGGVLVTNSATIDANARMLRNHGLLGRDTVAMWGVNSRLDTLHALVALAQMPDVHATNARRVANAKRLDEGLSLLAPRVRVPVREHAVYAVYHLYLLEVDDRDELIRYLADHEIEAKIHYPTPLHLQPAAQGLGYKPGDFPVAERLARRQITLPVHPYLSAEQLDYMVETVTAFYTQ